jgi:hypothetical protein
MGPGCRSHCSSCAAPRPPRADVMAMHHDGFPGRLSSAWQPETRQVGTLLAVQHYQKRTHLAVRDRFARDRRPARTFAWP